MYYASKLTITAVLQQCLTFHCHCNTVTASQVELQNSYMLGYNVEEKCCLLNSINVRQLVT